MIDAHVHAFPDPAAGRRWQEAAGFLAERPGTIEDVGTRMAAAGIDSAILLLFGRPGHRMRELIAAGADPDQARRRAADELRAYNSWGLDVARRDARFHAFVGVDPRVLDPDELASEISAAAAAGARGVKIVPPAMRLYADDPLLDPVHATCVEVGLPLLSQSGGGGSGPSGPRGPWGRPGPWDAVLRRHPNLRVVLAHLAHGLEEELVELMHRQPSVVSDTSLALGHPRDPQPWDTRSADRVVALIRRLGTDRVLFGTNYPITDPVAYAERLRALPLTDPERIRIERTNAARLLGI